MRRALVLLLLLAPLQAAALDARPLAYSLLLPGLGEWSMGYKGRALGHWALEAGCWTGTVYWRNRGFDKRHEYEDYADEHWHTARWASAWLEEQPDWLDWIDASEWDAMAWDQTCDVALDLDEGHPGYLQSHYAPWAEDPQHYYENLGKYDWYRWGWDDYDCSDDHKDPVPGSHRWTYGKMRNESDLYFDRAHGFLTVLLLGRVVSLVDTYIILVREERGQSPEQIRDGWRLQSGMGQRGEIRMGLARSW